MPSKYIIIVIYSMKLISRVQSTKQRLYKLNSHCTPNKTPNIRPLASHHQTNQTRRTLLEKQGRTHQDDQLEHTYSSYVRIRDITLKTCQKRWMIGRSGERGSGISVLAARHDDDDDIDYTCDSLSFILFACLPITEWNGFNDFLNSILLSMQCIAVSL